ncbi:cell division protein FtsW [Candidatus Kaiserbacteria bacterium]|nr:cell division protein FtsW [Candidatus Kaiserbacteria bacterium]
MRRSRIDTTLAFLIALLVVGGAFIFASAAFGLLARGSSGMTSVFFSHLVLGIGTGLVALLFAVNIDVGHLRRYAPYIFVAALIATALVFVPHLGASHGGGRRWIILLGTSLQPSEAMKLATLIMAAAYFAGIKGHVNTILYGLGGFAAIVIGPSLLLLLQPDLGTLGVIGISSLSIFWAAGARKRDIALMVLIGLIALAALAYAKPYVRDRVQTFLDPSQGQLEESYQIRQSLIAIGSGQLLGRGFGQGVQKFTYLPEPMGDSIFAVASEELGFAGASAIIILFTLFVLRGYHIAARAADPFAKYLAVGISTYLVCEAFINIAALLGLAPLTGIPLTFISQGGTAMMVSLASAGVLLSISRKRHKA